MTEHMAQSISVENLYMTYLYEKGSEKNKTQGNLF
jgi:hypothetical protein